MTEQSNQTPQPGAGTAAGLWSELDGLRQEVLSRAETYAQYTIPTLFMPQGQNTDTDASGHTWQSVGAQAVNNLATRLMLALFAPSRPFLRLDPTDEYAEAARLAGVSEADLRTILAEGERKTVKTLDRLALRPKLYELLKQLIVAGNVLAVFNRAESLLRVMSLRYFCVKRDVQGRVLKVVIKESVCLDELEQGIQDQVTEVPDDKIVDFYILVERQPDGKYKVSQHVGNQHFTSFDKTYTEQDCPYKVLTWSLSDEANYGTSLVGDYEGDFAALTKYSSALVTAGILASEFRWLVSAASGTRPEDFEDSENGQALSGEKDAVTLLNAAGEVADAMQVQQSVIADYVNRIGRGFIMASSVTRDAERVTAQEIRLLANELENGLGGGYSRLAVDLQIPMGHFLLAMNKITVDGKSLELTVVTGLDALSRNGDLENLQGWLADVQSLGAAPPLALERLKMDVVLADLATPRGIDAKKYLRSDEEVQGERNDGTARDVAVKTATQGAPSA